MRNEHGEWIKVFSRNIGKATSFTAKLWGLRDGLTLCKVLNLCDVDIQINAKAVIELLANPLYSNTVVTHIVDDCRCLLSQIPQVRLNHCYRKANGCADFLAKKGITQDGDFFVYVDPPLELLELINSDFLGMHHNKLCPDTLLSL